MRKRFLRLIPALLAVCLILSGCGNKRPEDGLEDGVYGIDVTSSSSMFKIVDCKLTVAGGEMTAVITLSGVGFEKLYLGTGEQADKEDANLIGIFAVTDGKNSFAVPVSALDAELQLTGLSAKKQEWYDHTVVFKSDTLREYVPPTPAPSDDPADASPAVSAAPGASGESSSPAAGVLPDGEYLVAAALTGGSGKVSVESPARLTVKDGKATAVVVWSSKSYTFMRIGGVIYDRLSGEEYSTFEIPVILDADIAFSAETTAMSQPHEIEYTIRFDSAGLEAVK